MVDTLLAAFAEETGVRVTVLPSPEGADLLLDPASRPAGPERDAREVCWTGYVVLGPPSGARRSYGEWNYESWARGRSPLGARGALTGSSASMLFREIRLSAFPFVSRGDDSENHLLEMRLWAPEGPCRGVQYTFAKLSSYTETRETMDRTLAIADEASAYTLCDLTTYLRLRKTIRLEVVLARDAELRVPYRATLVEHAPDPTERSRAARRLHDWLGSENCREVLKTIRVDGERPFYAPDEDLAATIRGRLDSESPDDDEARDEDR